MIVKIAVLIAYALVNILHAYLDAQSIRMGYRIYHGINGAIHLITVLLISFLLGNYIFGIGLLALRRIVFDTALNLFRGLRFDYISSTTTSIIDRISYRIQSKVGYIPYYGLFFIIIILTTIYHGKS